ncbi:MAG: dinitrogenase iron-molybdenum cofactor, partial [Elusimicrobia bacterium]|nr:dinitrogenase iron-molybdenum cofactor [Elusimicrobiota bacterium]
FEESPEHQPGAIPKWLSSKGANVVIAGGAGAMAQNLFGGMGIQLILGVSGPVNAVAQKYLDGKLTAGESLCDNC